MSKLSDLLLSSGFDNPWDPSGGMDRTMQALHDAILEALFSGGVLPPDVVEQAVRRSGRRQRGRDPPAARAADPADHPADAGVGLHHRRAGSRVRAAAARRRAAGPDEGEPQQVQFEVTDKALDFLGFRALRDLLGSLGHSSAGRHDTRDLSTGVETSGAPKPYEFGDTLNIDATATILNAVSRQAAERRRRRRGPAVSAAPATQPEPGAGPGVATQRHRHRLPGPDGGAGRVSELVRDGADARLQPQHDPLRRGPLHARPSAWRWRSRT